MNELTNGDMLRPSCEEASLEAGVTADAARCRSTR